jgi:hypothetical protein
LTTLPHTKNGLFSLYGFAGLGSKFFIGNFYKSVTRIKTLGKNVLAGRCDVHREVTTSESKPEISSLLLDNVVKVMSMFSRHDLLFLALLQ